MVGVQEGAPGRGESLPGHNTRGEAHRGRRSAAHERATIRPEEVGLTDEQ
jgi:hypothetical protein